MSLSNDIGHTVATADIPRPATKPRQVAAGYERLAAVLDEALGHASHGKGKERHADAGPFEEQPTVTIGRWLESNHFALGQAIKKARESARLEPARARHELLGAICYLAAAVIGLDEAGK